jgi:CRP-like cAMP-binding protein
LWIVIGQASIILGSLIGIRVLTEFLEPKIFGELALINNEPRSLSIRVKSDTCKLLKLDRDAFTRILGSIEQHLKKDYDNELETKMDLIKT